MNTEIWVRIQMYGTFMVRSLTRSLIKEGYNATQVNRTDCTRGIYLARLIRELEWNQRIK